MKRYIIVCKDQKQWDDYVETHRFFTQNSLILTMKEHENSFVITDNLGKQSVYVKMVPCKNYRKSFPIGYSLMCEKVWLCDKEEFTHLCWADKYL